VSGWPDLAMIEWARPGALWLLVPLALWFWWAGRRPLRLERPGPRLRHPGIEATGTPPPYQPQPGRWLRPAALVLLTLAFAQPREPGEWIEPPPVGRDIALVIDLSGSMGLRDFTLEGRSVSRLEMVRHVLGEFVPQREADRFALMVFGSAAAQLMPPSFDREHLLLQLERLQPGVLGDLSAVGDALALGVRSVRHERLRPALIFIGDGDPANAGTVHPAEALAVAVAHDVAIHTLQIGPGPTDEAWEASDAPGMGGDPQPRFEDIARLSGGHFGAVLGVDEARAFFAIVDELEPTLRPQARERVMREWYPWLLWLAAGLLVVDRVHIRRRRHHTTGEGETA
jgi:Ca-activated chloride channel homolog